MVGVDEVEETKKALTNPNESLSSKRKGETVCGKKNVLSMLDQKCKLWVVFFGCCALHFIVFGMHYSFGAMFTKLLTKFNKGQEQTGNYTFES